MGGLLGFDGSADANSVVTIGSTATELENADIVGRLFRIAMIEQLVPQQQESSEFVVSSLAGALAFHA
nr:hypothetical protein [Sinorhizobium sp. M14]